LIIRCERCSTMYELEESLLAPEGSQVQCTKCQLVFVAVPPRAAGRTLPGMPAADAASKPAPAHAAPARSAPAREPPAREGPAARAARTGSPAVYHPPTSGAPVRAPVLKRDTVGTFEARLRWTARWRWLGPVLGGAVVVLVAVGWLLLSRSSRPTPSDTRAEALALMALDDAGSLDEAARKLADARGSGRKAAAASADRALALALRTAGVSEERDALAVRLAAASDERERLRREASAAGDGEGDGLAATVAGLEREVRARDEQLRSLATAAADQLRGAEAAGAAAPDLARAAASLHALRGERDALEKVLRAGKDGGRRDAWLDLAEGWIDARDPDRAVRERALVKLGALASARPDLLRARFLLARAEVSLGRRAEARAAVDGILSANRRHEGARRLREELSAPPAPVAAAPSPPPAPPPAERAAPPPQRRKPVAQPAPAASAPSPAAPDGAEAPAPPPRRPAPAAARAPDAAAPAAPAPAAPMPAPPAAAPPGDRASPDEAGASAPPRPPRALPEPSPDPGSQGG
jgi:predicted Zn finger-like uncharacterized protein